MTARFHKMSDLLASLSLTPATVSAIVALGPIERQAPKVGESWQDPNGVRWRLYTCDCGCAENLMESSQERGWVTSSFEAEMQRRCPGEWRQV